MRILLVAATEFEIRPFLGQMTFLRKDGDLFQQYLFRSVPVDVLIPGVGMMQTAFSLGKFLGKTKYSLAINAGIAGTYHASLKIGTVVNVTEECIPEMGAEDGESFVSMFELGLMDPDGFPYIGGKLRNSGTIDSSALQLLPRVKGNTVNLVHGARKSIEKVKNLFPAEIESMEGAAFLYACLAEEIPCAQIRSVSNFVEERDRSRWNVPLALKNLNKTLHAVMNDMVE